MKKMAPVGQNREGDEVSNSDSGDSIFLTQKPAPAVRSRREKSPHLSPFWAQEDLADREDEASLSSSSNEKHKTNRNQRERVLRVPTFNLSFSSKRKRRSDLPRDKVKKLYNYVMGGFFNSVQELWESYERGKDMAESLPTVDVDGECISPISEKGTMEEEDIKVVERKHFATSIKAKSSRPWCTPKTRSNEEGKPSQELRGSQGERQKSACQVSECKPADKVAPFLAIQMSDTLCRHLKETETFVMRDENIRTETETGNHLIEKKKQLGNESNHELNPKRDTQRDGDPHTELLHEDGQSSSGNAECIHDKQTPTQSDVSNDSLRLKKMKKKGGGGGRERVETGTEQSQEEKTEGEPEEQLPGLLEDINMTTVLDSEPEKNKHAAAGRQDQSAESAEEASGVSSQAEAEWEKKKDVDVESKGTNKTADPPTNEVNIEKKKDVNVTSDLSQTPTGRPGEVGADFEEETLGSSFIKRKKKKQKEHPASSDKDVNFSNDAVTNADLTVKKKKKKKMVDVSHTAEEDESVDNTQTEERDAELGTKNKKKLKNSWSIASCEDAIAAAENSVFVWKKKKKRTSSFLPADGEENGVEEEHNPLRPEAEKPDVSTNDLAATSEEFPESSAVIKIRFKKKKKRSAEQDCVKGETKCEEPKEPAEAEVKKKKRKRDDGETMSPTEKCVDESQAEAHVPLRKKKTISPAATEDAESEFGLDSRKNLKKNKAAGKLSLEKKSFPKTADSEARKSQQTGRAKPDTDCNFSPATSHMKQKKNGKRRLHDPNQDFLSNF